jgi:sugar lactone lactonase YvrE
VPVEERPDAVEQEKRRQPARSGGGRGLDDVVHGSILHDAGVEVLLDRGTFFESPRWHEGRWWVSDFFSGSVLAVGTDGRAEEVLRLEGRPSGLGWLPDGSLLVVSMLDRRLLRRAASGRLAVHAELEELCGGHANDLVVTAEGRAYVGNFGFDLDREEPSPTRLVRVDPDGSAHEAAGGLLFPNGSVVSPDGRTLIVGETFGRRYTAFSIEADGTLAGRRLWADLRPARIAPDGCALDAEGRIWAADARHGRCCRIAEGGAVLDEIAIPDGLRCFACMLGGADGRTLLLCAAPDYDPRRRTAAREALLLTEQVEVPHDGLP